MGEINSELLEKRLQRGRKFSETSWNFTEIMQNFQDFLETFRNFQNILVFFWKFSISLQPYKKVSILSLYLKILHLYSLKQEF